MMSRLIVILFVIIPGILAVAACDRTSQEVATGEVKIIRDAYGVPHIYAKDNFGLFYGYGYAVAQDRLFQMEMLKRTTQGTVSEVLGAKYIEVDKLVRQGFSPLSIHQQIEALPSSQRKILDGYAAGMNKWTEQILAQPEKWMPKEFIDHGFAPSTWTAYDVVMVFAGSIAHRYSDFNTEIDNLAFLEDLTRQHGKAKAWQIFRALHPVYDDQSITTVSADEKQYKVSVTDEKTPPLYLDQLMRDVAAKPRLALDDGGKYLPLTDPVERAKYLDQKLAEAGLPGMAGFRSASNLWAVKGNKVTGAKAILINGPQFGWSNPSYVYEVGLHGPDYDVVGNTLSAFPALLFAHNNYIGWGSTAGFGDLVDIYQEQLNPTDPEQYFYHGAWQHFERRAEIIKVKGAEDISYIVRRSIHGPVIQIEPDKNMAFSKKRSWEGHEVETLMAWIDLPKAKDYKALRKSMAKMATNINFYMIDREGNLGYTHTGKYPIRVSGQDIRLPALGQGDMEWQGYQPFDQNPSVYNPKQDFLTNWNNRPARGWPNSDLWWISWAGGHRVDVLVNALKAQNKFTPDQLWNIARKSAYSDLNIGYLLPELTQALAQVDETDETMQALDLLRQWDGQWNDVNQDGYFDGAAPALMESWMKILLEDALKDDVGVKFFSRYASPGYPTNPTRAGFTVPVGLKALLYHFAHSEEGYDLMNGQKKAAFFRQTFLKAVAILKEKYGAISEWHVKPYPLTFTAYNFRGVLQGDETDQPTLPVAMNRGTENNMFIATGNGLTGFDVVPPGQSGFIGPDGTRSSHYSDQMDLYLNFKNKPLHFSEQEVLKARQSEEILTYSPH